MGCRLVGGVFFRVGWWVIGACGCGCGWVGVGMDWWVDGIWVCGWVFGRCGYGCGCESSVEIQPRWPLPAFLALHPAACCAVVHTVAAAAEARGHLFGRPLARPPGNCAVTRAPPFSRSLDHRPSVHSRTRPDHPVVAAQSPAL